MLFKAIFRIIPLFCLCLSFNALADEIRIYSANADPNFQSYHFSSPHQPTTPSWLDLGESLSEKYLEISSTARDSYRVQLQLQTSLTIMDEGPHLDLINWKHCTTDWIEVDAVSATQFKLPAFNTIDIDCFPAVTATEIKQRVLEEGGERWANLIADNATINNYPIDTALSLVRIKIEKYTHSHWRPLTVIKFSVPMGC